MLDGGGGATGDLNVKSNGVWVGGGGRTEGKMYPWPGKLLSVAVPLVGAGPAPPCTPFAPPSVTQLPLFVLLRVPSAPRLPALFQQLFYPVLSQGALVPQSAVLLAVVLRSPNAAALSESGAAQLR